MDLFNFGGLNYWAILLALVFNQLLGMAWYSLLAKPWMAELGLAKKDLEKMKGTPRQWYPYLLAIISTAVFTVGLALLIQALEIDTALGGLGLGLLAAVGFVMSSLATNYGFEGRSFKLFLINGGYPLIGYAAIGLWLATQA